MSSTDDVRPLDSPSLRLAMHASLSFATTLVLSLAPSTFGTPADSPRIVYVDRDASGANDGSSWQDAFQELARALALITPDVTSESIEVWVAEGTYRPTNGQIRTEFPAFLLGRQMQVFGGFAGGETSRNQRNPGQHPTILSGEVGEPGTQDNSLHVVRVLTFQPTLIDGFIIRDGNSVGNSPGGAGILVDGASPIQIHGCTFIANRSTQPGAAIRLTNGNAKAVISDCLFVANHALGPGAAAIQTGRPTEIRHGTFAGNIAASTTGAAIVVEGQGAGSIVDASLLFANSGPSGVTFTSEIQATVPTTLSRSHVQALGSATSTLTIIDCEFASSAGGVVNARGEDGLFGTADDDFRPDPCSTIVDRIGGAAALDIADLDGDGSVTDPMPFDLFYAPRAIDLPAPNALDAFRDVGAIERQPDALPSPDITGDGIIDAADLAILLGGWNPQINCSSADLNADGAVDGADLAILLGAWSE